MADETFHPEEILKLEFEYASRTAEQAQDDRTAILNLYLLIAGGVGSIAVALPELSAKAQTVVPDTVYALMLGLLGVAGFFAVFQLVRLRQSWYDSALTMNCIKDFYLERFPELAPAFRWRTETIPAPGKLWAISFNLAMLVVIIDTVAVILATHLGNFHPLAETFSELLVGAVCILLQVGFYFFQLRKP